MIQPHSRTKPLRKQERNCPAIEIVSQIHRGRAIAFRIEAGGEIRIAQYGISNPAAFYICDNPCFSKFWALRGCVRRPTDNLRTFVCSLHHQWTKHNRAKPMSELASALFSIADANEFRFARFYIVCEAVMLGTLKSPLIVCGVSDTSRGLSKRGKTRNWI